MTTHHSLENNIEEMAYCERVNKPGSGLGMSSYRQAVIATTGTPLLRCQCKRATGPKPKIRNSRYE
jgi:hypothetical protein